ncbi:MAG: hypothetical protein AB8B91_11475 [Rubripirellula sp.]
MSPLSGLLKDWTVEQTRLIDVACIDLMQRRRAGVSVTVEDYVADLPVLSNCSDQLDLIDAEICILQELGLPVEIDRFVDRFPQFAKQIHELGNLECGNEKVLARGIVSPGLEPRRRESSGSLPDAQDNAQESSSTCDPAIDATVHSIAGSEEFSVEIVRGEREPATEVSTFASHPVDVPDWFVGADCVASGPGRWLIRGRDSVRGTALALKVTKLPMQLTADQSEQILDACETAAKVRNPSWVLPSVAAIQQRHLGVIRPWLFARPWQQVISTLDTSAQMRLLASVAFTLAAAHKVGAAHGGVHCENLLVDHEGKVHVLDAASSRIGLGKWLTHPETTGSVASAEQRLGIDVQDMIRLVVSVALEWNDTGAATLIDRWRHRKGDQRDACYEIGQMLINQADVSTQGGDVLGRMSWRHRFAQWLTRADG